MSDLTVKQPSIFIIAGEPSADALGGALMRSLKELRAGISIQGIGGDQMKSQGLKTLLPMNELCVMGLSEVFAHLPRLLKLIKAMVEEIEKRHPDIFISIDLPDFNFRVAQILKKRGVYKGKIIHYVAPSVWAWRPGRAQKIAQYLDGLLCLFPFEPEYFLKHNLKAEFAGHPVVETKKSEFSKTILRDKLSIAKDDLCVGVLFGSRERELKVMSPVLLDTILALHEQYPDMKVIAPTLPHFEFEVTQIVKQLPVPSFVIADPKWKWQAFSACNVAVAVSGTVGLELAYAGTPHIIAYKMNPISAFFIKMLVKIKHAHLANIILGREAIPEYIQSRCTAMKITTGMLELIQSKEKRDEQKKNFEELSLKIAPQGEDKPSRKAAEFVLSYLEV